MEQPIVNKVAESALEVLDPMDFFGPKPLGLDLKDFLDQGLILREKDFRAAIKAHDWDQYTGKSVAVYCSTEAILPAWAPLLVGIQLADKASTVGYGSPEAVELQHWQNQIQTFDWSALKDKPVILKGCAEKEIPQTLYMQWVALIKPYARSIFYGEACSAVPLWKRSNSYK
ncbi:MAG: DUF2480 family protein [Flavobacteriaceae bacterium]